MCIVLKNAPPWFAGLREAWRVLLVQRYTFFLGLLSFFEWNCWLEAHFYFFFAVFALKLKRKPPRYSSRQANGEAPIIEIGIFLFCYISLVYKKRPTLVRWSCDEKRGGIRCRKGTTFHWNNNPFLKETAHLRHIFTSFLQLFLKLVLELHPWRDFCGFLRSPFGVVGCTFVPFWWE